MSARLVVDLGYQRNQGRLVENNDTLVTFRNVRYGAPPLGDLRFRAPVELAADSSGIQDHPDVVPPQAYPGWLLTGDTTPITTSSLPPSPPGTSEDCLFLDVLSTKAVWDNRESKKAPVLVWVPGGGYDVGWKDASGAGNGLVARSPTFGNNGIILVSINYRLGLFGWLHGEGVDANAGLLDQQFALRWIQKNIGRFGGDKTKVTLLGESAGGGSILAHVTAHGGRSCESKAPFTRVIVQSPYLVPAQPSNQSTVEYALKYANVDSIQSLRQQSTEKLQEINSLLIGNAVPFGSFIYGPVVDGKYVKDLPARLLLEGHFDESLSIMTGHNQDEGSRFVPNKNISDEKSYNGYLSDMLPPQDSVSLGAINQLYPSIFDSSQGYTNQAERNSLTIADALLVCNALALNTAGFRKPTYAYEFTVPPGLHGADLPYTFYDFGDVEGVDSTVATTLQRYLTNFALTSDPNTLDLPPFGPYDQNKNMVQNIGPGDVAPIPNEAGVKQLPARCRFWQQAPYVARK